MKKKLFMFTKNDLSQFEKQKISLEIVETQIQNFENGFPFLNIFKSASINDGILKFPKKDLKNLEYSYKEKIKNKKIVKFVPASGAASRMFKELFDFKKKYKNKKISLENFEDKNFYSVYNFFKNIKNFAFYDDLKNITEENFEMLLKKKEWSKIIDCFLNKEFLNYGNLPKALLKFHKNKEKNFLSLEEHFLEGANYCGEKVNLHFTISPEHKNIFNKNIEKFKHFYEKKFSVKYNIELSEQKKSTDIIAVDLENRPFREENNSILFRPGGHGALIENLNEIDADIIFIKNIDNVAHSDFQNETFIYKKVLLALLIEYQKKIFYYIKKLKDGKKNFTEIESFFKEIGFCFSEKIKNFSELEKKRFYIKKLNRPIRVCGMVKNEGESGGGPFWVESNDGFSLQIVESSQIDLNKEEKSNLLKKSTHFNPVDLVCGVKNYKGEKFNLKNFIDKNTGFISKKSKNGKNLKAQELPGLWNGAMSNWNTIFVEVPIITFNPVKKINDLMRKEHQNFS